MLRTQISLTEGLERLLDEESARTGRSMSQLVREPVHAHLGESRSVEDDVELLAGMRAHEEPQTRGLLSAVVIHPVDEAVGEEAGALAVGGSRATRGSTRRISSWRRPPACWTHRC